MRLRNALVARLGSVFAALAAFACAQAQATPKFGVDFHLENTTVDLNTQRAAIMKARGLTTTRIGIVDSYGDTALRHDLAQKVVANGGTVQAIIAPSFTWDSSCNPDLAAVESRAYSDTATAVNKVKDVIHDFELMNETQLRSEILNETSFNNIGSQTAPYAGKPCVASLAAALRGMSRAIHDIGASSGLPLRVILGEVGRDWGFLTFMQQQGVNFDVIGWHVYPHLNYTSMLTDPWYGAGGPYAQLALFGKPVTVNEFNCGEIYDSGYENQAGATVTENCLKSFDKHLTDMVNQTKVKIESVLVYELTDEPRKRGPEGRFGLMYDLGRPKPQMYLLEAFAGGPLTSQERYEVSRRGLMKR